MTFSVYSLIQMSIGKHDFFELQADLTQHFIYVFILTILFTVGYLFIFPYSLHLKKKKNYHPYWQLSLCLSTDSETQNQ